MQREFLKDLGLGKEVIDQIMAENGKDIQAEQDKAKTKLEEVEAQLNADLAEAQKTIKSMQRASDDADKVQEKADEYKQKYEEAVAERNAIERTSAIEKALIANQANSKYLATLASYIPDDVELDKIDDEVAKIKGDYGELFQVSNQEEVQSAGGYKVIDNKLKDGEPTELTKQQIFAITDPAERQKKIAENLHLFR